MTQLITSDRLSLADEDTREGIVCSDSFICGRGGGWHDVAGVIMRLNHLQEPLWHRSYFSYNRTPDPTGLGAFCWGGEIVLTKDEQYLYAVGDGDQTGIGDPVPNFLKLDAATGDIVWEREISSLLGFLYITLDREENIIIWGWDLATFTVGILKKYSPDGDVLWTKAIGGVTGLACDSNNNVYCTVSNENFIDPATAPGLYKLDGENGNTLWDAPSTGYFRDVAINKDDDIFVIGSIEETNRQLFKYAPDSSTRLAAVEVGVVGLSIDNGQKVECDSLGNVIALNYVDSPGPGYDYWLVKFDSDLAVVWEHEYDWTNEGARMIAIDAHNRVHTWGRSTTAGAYKIHASSNGVLEADRKRISGQGSFTIFFGLVCSKDVYEGTYTDQRATTLTRPDMCCFHDANIPYIVLEENIEVDAKYWYWIIKPSDLWVSFHSPPDNWIGVFEGILFNPSPLGFYLVGNAEQMKQLSRTPSCVNENWESYDGFGGIGAAPQIYTVTFIDMLNVSDDEPSPYNGEYLLVVGPGLMGFFFRYENDAELKINFTVEDSYIDEDGYTDGDGYLIQGDNKEKLKFTIGSDEGNVFTYVRTIQDYDYNTTYAVDELVIDNKKVYKSQQAGNTEHLLDEIDWWVEGRYHNEKLTVVDNDNLVGTPNAIAYGGTASIYPGRIAQWDADTIWAINEIVAWEGRFYQADNQNQNSEPPSGNWTVL